MFRVTLFLLLALFAHIAASQCPVGRFINDVGDCVGCPGNTYNDVPDSSTCTQCPDGKISDFESTSVDDCKNCPQGMVIVFDNECETCDPGTFNDELNAKVCKTCPKGSFSNTYNPAYCSPCRAGRVTDNVNTNVCRLCKGKRYQPLLGRRKCRGCPKGSRANPDGASCRPTCNNPRKKKCRSCPPGSELTGSGSCRPCPAGKINTYTSNTQCQKCPDAAVPPFLVPSTLVPNADRTKCVCRPGEELSFDPFGPEELNPFCIPCPDGQTSDGETCM